MKFQVCATESKLKQNDKFTFRGALKVFLLMQIRSVFKFSNNLCLAAALWLSELIDCGN